MYMYLYINFIEQIFKRYMGEQLSYEMQICSKCVCLKHVCLQKIEESPILLII